MGFKEFITPTKGKIILAILLFFVLPNTIMKCGNFEMIMGAPRTCNTFFTMFSGSFLILGEMAIPGLGIHPIHFILLCIYYITISYLIASLIIFLIKKKK